MTRTIIALENPATGGTLQVLRGLTSQTGVSANMRSVFPGPYRDYITREKRLALAGYPPIEPGKFIRADAQEHISSFLSSIRAADPNCILALGNAPLWALTKHTGIARWRGIPIMSSLDVKVVPTWAPGAIIKQWELRPVAVIV